MKSLHRHQGTVVFFRNRPWLARTRPGRVALRVAHVWLPIIRRELAETRASLTPALVWPPHYRQWLCIHHYEGSWTDTGAPFWGGLQFGWSEWQRFGGRFASTADQASPVEQMWAAEAYWRLSGFSPWPNTARACGLL